MNLEKVKYILENTDNLEILFKDPSLSGFSGNKIIALLQNLSTCLNPDNEIYLEVGVFRGLSLLSVSKVFNGQTYGIDNFSQFDIEKKNFDLINDHITRLGLTNVNIVNSDMEAGLQNLPEYIHEKRIGLFFIDGPHDYRSQLMCLLLAKPFLSENAIIVIDDSNYRHVRQANADFLILFPSFKLVCEHYTSAHPMNMSQDDRNEAIKNWWNGINVIVNDTQNILPEKRIRTFDLRNLFYNDHKIHSSRYADCAPEAMTVTHVLKPFRPLKLILRLINLYKRIKKSDPVFHGKYRHLNTWSDDLV
jgi:hypothetical protein